MEEEDLRYEGRRDAFDDLLQELGSQLSKSNLDTLEVLERVPEDLREKGGIKLLEYFRNQGKFSLWRTATLHSILSKCGRYDLAEVVKDSYQSSFPDLAESPKLKKRLSTPYERTGSSLLVRSTPRHARSNSSPVPHERVCHRRASSLDHGPSWPVEEENTASGTPSFVGPSHTRGFAVSKSPSPSEFSYSSSYPPPFEEESACWTMMSGRPKFRHRRSCDECGLKEKAIDAVVRIIESKSCTDITHSAPNDEENLKSRSEASLGSGCRCVNDKTPTLHRRDKSSSDSGQRDTMGFFINDNLDELTKASPPHAYVNTADKKEPLSVPSTLPTPTSRRLKLPRPISGYRKPQNSIMWELKKDHLQKCINKSGNEKVVFSEKIDLDVGHGKHNPKLCLVLYPKGLFHYVGKSASLQANISATDRCPPLSPSLLVQANIIVFGTHKQRVLKRCSEQETVNMRSFYIHNLFRCDSIELEDHLLLEISVQIQKATEET